MNGHILGYLLGLGLMGKLVHIYLKRRQESKKKIDQQSGECINEVLFFPDSEYPCMKIITDMTKLSRSERVCHNPACRKLHGARGEPPSSMIKFLEHLASAKRSVDLCIYVFTQTTLSKILHDLHKSGVKVRIITDGREEEAYGSQVSRLRDAGVEIKSNKSKKTNALMHHKFVVIDEKILLSGSFNWTSSAVVSNYEAVLVTSNRSLVEPFVLKFDELWWDFSSHTSTPKSFVSPDRCTRERVFSFNQVLFQDK